MADAPKDTSDVQQSTFEDDQPNGETNTGAIACSTAEASNSTHLSITESNSLGQYTANYFYFFTLPIEVLTIQNLYEINNLISEIEDIHQKLIKLSQVNMLLTHDSNIILHV